MAYKPKDHYFHKAKKENYVARSVYKIQEIDQKFRLFHKNDYILDLGASPGSWSQYCLEKIGPQGLVVGVDLKPVEIKDPRFSFFRGDLREWDAKYFASRDRVNVEIVTKRRAQTFVFSNMGKDAQFNL